MSDEGCYCVHDGPCDCTCCDNPDGTRIKYPKIVAVHRSELEVETMTFNEWVNRVLEQRPSQGDIRWGQAVMNASPVGWAADLPDVWELDSFYDPQVQQWYDRAAKEFS